MAVSVPGALSPPLDSDWRPIQHETQFAIRILNHPSFILIFNYGCRWLCYVILWPAYIKYRKMINTYIYVSLSLFQLQVEPSGSLKGEMHFQKNCLLSSPSPTRGPWPIKLQLGGRTPTLKSSQIPSSIPSCHRTCHCLVFEVFLGNPIYVLSSCAGKLITVYSVFARLANRIQAIRPNTLSYSYSHS